MTLPVVEVIHRGAESEVKRVSVTKANGMYCVTVTTKAKWPDINLSSGVKDDGKITHGCIVCGENVFDQVEITFPEHRHMDAALVSKRYGVEFFLVPPTEGELVANWVAP